MRKLFFEDLKTIEYGTAWELQEYLLKTGNDAKIKLSKEPHSQIKIPNYLLMCQHPHVYTLGKHGDAQNLLLNSDNLRKKNIAFYKTNRGGDITYHGPGQLVAYPILDLEQFFTDIRKYIDLLEESIIHTIAEYGIKGERLQGSTGVWISPNAQKARKICAIGIRCRRWITIHGLALNINTNLEYFKNIIPCGIANKGVTSMEQELGEPVDEKEVAQIFCQKFASIFKAELITNNNSLINEFENLK